MAPPSGKTIIGMLTIVIGAAIFYCNSRINRLENSINTQQQVLSSFIANVQETLFTQRGGHNVGAHQSLSSPEADDAASQFMNNNKIVVSDNEVDSKSPNDSDSDSESDSDSDEDRPSNTSDDDGHGERKEVCIPSDINLLEFDNGEKPPMEEPLKPVTTSDFIQNNLKTDLL